MSSKRLLQIESEIYAHIATLLTTGKLSDPRLRGVTIQSVKVTADLQSARIYYSFFGENIDKKEVAKGFTSAAGFIRKSVGQHLQLRYTLALSFELDTSIEYAAHMHKILKSVREEME